MALANGFRVNTNISAYNTYRSYDNAQVDLEKNIERLSSGLRINRASDNTAGQAITQRMKNQATGMRQAVHNSQQATNYLQTAEGGLNEIHGILARMRELAVQSSSDNLNSNDRYSLELEYSHLKEEVTRIANSTTYNDMTLINGDRAKEVIKQQIPDTQIKSYSVASNVVNAPFDFTHIEAGKITMRNLVAESTQTLHHPDGGFIEDDVLNFDQLGITITLGTDFANIEEGTGDSDNYAFGVDDGNFVTMQVGAYNDANHASDRNVGSLPSNGSWESEVNRITLNISDASANGLGISDSGVSALADSQRAINDLDLAIEKINDERSNIGALQNRFELAVSNLQSSIQNTDASRSTILDADFALEAAGMAKNQILTQSGTAMLAQANQISQNILSLLK